jgi:hypothetical protein
MTAAEPGAYQLFPDLADDDYAALKRDIAERGVMVAVEYDDLGEILDGHHRVRAWTELVYEGVELEPYPRVVREGMTEAQKRAHVRRLNILRRHLTQEQKRELIRDQVRETPAASDNSIGKSLGVHNETVGAVRRQMVAEGSLTDSVSERQGIDGRVINTAHIGRAPSPRRAPDPDFSDDYVEDVPSRTADETIALPETAPVDLESLADERDEDGSIARARLLAQYSRGMAAICDLGFLHADAVVRVLSRERRVIHRENVRLLRLWLDAVDRELDAAEERPLQVVGGTRG